MKKIIQVCICVLFLCCPLVPTSLGAEGDLLLDYANLLTESEEITLEAEMNRISSVTGYSVGAILYTEKGEYYEWLSINGSDFIVLAVNMSSRQVDFNVAGSAFSAMNDGKKDAVLDAVTPYLTKGNYKEAIQVYLGMTDSYVTGHVSEEEAKRQKTAAFEAKLPFYLMTVVISFLGALGITVTFVKSMNNVQNQDTARAYQGQHYITMEREIFLYRTVTSVSRQQNRGGNGGGGGSNFSGGRSRGF